MRILMPSIVDPGARSGASTVTRNLIRLLESPPLSASVECLAIPRTTGTAHRVRQAVAISRSMLSSMPAKVAYTYSTGFRRRVLARVTSQPADAVIINGSDLLWLESLLPEQLPRFLVVHNIEYELFASQIGGTPKSFPLMHGVLQRQYRQLKQSEHEGMRRAGNAIFLSNEDAELVRDADLTSTSIVVPPLFGEHVVRQPRQVRSSSRLELGFLGNLHWWPNREGLSWFLQAVLPRITRPIHLNVFGDGLVPAMPSGTLVTRHGPIEDVSHAWDACDLMICPMRSGGGVSIKLAEAVFHGMPSLATPFAARGLPLGSDPCLVVKEESHWVSYLNTVDLMSIRGRCIAAEVSQAFTYPPYRHRLHEFVARNSENGVRRHFTGPDPVRGQTRGQTPGLTPN